MRSLGFVVVSVTETEVPPLLPVLALMWPSRLRGRVETKMAVIVPEPLTVAVVLEEVESTKVIEPAEDHCEK